MLQPVCMIILGDYLLQRFSPVPYMGTVFNTYMDQILTRVCARKILTYIYVTLMYRVRDRQEVRKEIKWGKLIYMYIYACVRYIYRRRGYVYEICWYRFVSVYMGHTYQAYWYQSSILVLNVQCSYTYRELFQSLVEYFSVYFFIFLIVVVVFIVRINIICLYLMEEESHIYR